MEKILVFGHKNPDTDAICSSLVMADLQTKIREEFSKGKACDGACQSCGCGRIIID